MHIFSFRVIEQFSIRMERNIGYFEDRLALKTALGKIILIKIVDIRRNKRKDETCNNPCAGQKENRFTPALLKRISFHPSFT